MTNHSHNHNPNHNKIIHHHHNHLLQSTTTTTTTTTTRSNSTIQACAACRYQRRKCAPDCILAPYFPHDRQRQFQNAHKLFGVSNITKIIRHLDQPQKDEAMRTIIYQSDVRAQDPVGGCYRIIRELHRQIEISRAELEIVLQQLAYCRTLAVQNQTHFNQDQIVIDEVDCDIHLVNNPDDADAPLYDDSSVDRLHRRNGLDLDLDNIPLQQQEHNDHDQYVSGKQDWNGQGTGWEDDQVPMPAPVQSWAAGHDSPPPSANCFDVKPQPYQTLHASVCVDFKSLLLNEIPSEEKFEFKDTNEPSAESLFNEVNHKALIKEENVSYKIQYHNEDLEVKDATFATLKDCKATQIEGE